VVNDLLAEDFIQKADKIYKGSLSRLADYLKDIRKIYLDCRKYILDKNEVQFQEVAARDLVELYSYQYVGYLLLDEAEMEPRKIFIANRYIVSALAKARSNAEAIKNEQFSDLLHADEILN
jgi:hypothetical protein